MALTLPPDPPFDLRPLIEPAAIVDRAGLIAALATACAGDDTMAAVRKILAQTLKNGRLAIRNAFETSHRQGYRAAQATAWLTDVVVQSLYQIVTQHQHPLAVPTASERLTVVAVGGYGRAEMAPFSDVDLLFLMPYKQTAWGESVIESMLHVLWDLRLKVGHAVRSVDDCLRLAASDITIRTALLERRYLCGDRELAQELGQRLKTELFAQTGPAFVEEKLAERDARHQRAGGSRYLLEPNIKESKGGLRDLQTLFWIGKYLYQTDSLTALIERGVFTAAEAEQFRRAYGFLWAVRFALHYLHNRAHEHLSFDAQMTLAENFGYRTRRGLRGVERFMKHYFHNAKQVGDLTRIFCAALEAQHKKTQRRGMGALLGIFSGSGLKGLTEKRAPDWVKLQDGRITVKTESVLDDPLNIFRLVAIGIRNDVLIHPAAMRMITRRLRLIDDKFRQDPKAAELFMWLLCDSGDPERALRRLSEFGVLARYLPEFGRITGMMQFNMYHHYTVDEHSITAIGILRRLEKGELQGDHPVADRILRGKWNRRILYTALLVHDIGKGLPEDHSIAGERIALELCPRLGLTPAETETIAWLVRQHLTMSDVAQKRDLNDDKTIADFAAIVQSPERLKLLLVLTVCDIRAVGPNVWNGWKAQLLRQLYNDTDAILSGGHSVDRTERVELAQQRLRELLRDWPSEKVDAHIATFFPSYWLGLDTATHLLHARMSERDPPDGISMDVTPDHSRAATKVCFRMPDHPGIFARMAGALALAGASIVDARAFTTRDGMAVNAFWVQDSDGGAYDDPVRLDGLSRSVRRLLAGEVIARDALKTRRKLKKREQSFTVAPQVNIDNEASEIYTLIEVNGRDRVGLLHDLARALSDAGVNIFSAIIATYGERAVDVFYVRDLFGLKITQERKQQQITEKLLAALERSAETS